ncbi:MAG: hypothetical protein ACRCZI_10330 [Cetobacterium sp.]
MKRSESEINQAMAMLHKVLKPGATVHCVLRGVSGSGMTRRIDFYTIHKGGLIYLTGYMEAIGLGKRHKSKQGMVISGCGMDMGFATVYNLGCSMWPQGTPKPHGSRNGAPDSTGGYALKSDWI